jgi:prevent-host-death family protein
MRHVLKVSEAVRNFADYVNRVAYRGERFVLVRGNRPVAELNPVRAGKRLEELPALLAGLPHLSEAEAVSFAEDLDRARSDLSRAPVRDAWDS